MLGIKNRIIRYNRVSGTSAIGPEYAQHLVAITAHVEQHVGPVARVFHELMSGFVHIDVLHVEPAGDRDFHVLVTSGMSDRAMRTPKGAEDCKWAELCVCLPAEWRVSTAVASDARSYWPIGLLTTLAKIPHAFNSWLWGGHTVPNFDPATPYAKDTKLCGAMLAPPVRLPKAFWEMGLGTGEQISFFDVLPLYADEMEFKVKNGADALLQHFNRARHKGLINPARPSVLVQV